jgi:hypothetical protein
MKTKHLFLFILLFLLGTVLAPAQTLLRGRLTTNDAAWQESPFLPGLTATNLTVANSLTVSGGVLRPLQSGTNILFETNAGRLIINSTATGGGGGGSSLITNANQFGPSTTLTIKDTPLITNLWVYGNNTNALRINSGVITSSLPALDISQTWSNANAKFSALTVNVFNTNSSNTSTLLELQSNSIPQIIIGRNGQMILQTGSKAAPSIWVTNHNLGNSKIGIYFGSGGQADVNYSMNGFNYFRWVGNSTRLGSSSIIAWMNASEVDTGSEDLIAGRDSAATLQLGTDAASPTTQTIKAHDGSGTDKAGADFNLAGGQGTGTGAGGTLNFRTAPAGASSTNTANAYVTRAVILPTGNIGFNTTNPTALLQLVPLSSTSTGILVKAAASQSADLLRVENSSGSKQVSIRSDGALDYADNAVISYVGGTSAVRWGSSRQSFGNQVAISSANNVSSPDLFLTRDAAATLQMGEDAATPTAQTLKGPDGSGTDKAGGELTVAPGKSTGAGIGGALMAKTSLTSASSSSAANVYSTRGYTYAGEVGLSDASAVGIADIVVGSGKYVGGDVLITIKAQDGFGGWSVNTVRINFSAYNDAGTVNAAYSTQQSSVIHSLVGSETISFSTSNPGSGYLRLLVTFTSDSWSETPTIRAKWQMLLNSDDEAPVTPL